jgi:hypothetical protein
MILSLADDADPITAESFGNGFTTTRAYFDEENRLKSIRTIRGQSSSPPAPASSETAVSRKSVSQERSTRLRMRSRARALQLPPPRALGICPSRLRSAARFNPLSA